MMVSLVGGKKLGLDRCWNAVLRGGTFRHTLTLLDIFQLVGFFAVDFVQQIRLDLRQEAVDVWGKGRGILQTSSSFLFLCKSKSMNADARQRMKQTELLDCFEVRLGRQLIQHPMKFVDCYSHCSFLFLCEAVSTGEHAMKNEETNRAA